ncbi:hypothetical protein DK389_28885 [Methylobacterium durans]|uniref:Uncharacterized protein n=1 Tax=Methylobacterium durans TaxID=2202825 RepID=A0A2U8WE29_9HYPH|nr:hypothetical protein DK389_28885 [Methylobacterium durans]
MPSPQNINAECAFITLEIETEIARISAILDAELVNNETTEDERREAVARWEQLKADMGRSNVIAQRTDEEIAAERFEMSRANDRFRAREAARRAAQQKEHADA